LSWMQTYKGRAFDPFAVESFDFDIEEIAHGLSQECRFGKQSTSFYSVAEHSVYVSRLANRPKWGLLHDIDEFILPDIPKPIKHLGLCEGFLTVAEQMRDRASIQFDLGPYPKSHIDKVEWWLMQTERQSVMADVAPGQGLEDWARGEGPNIKIACLNPKAAKAFFLTEASKLGLY